MEKYKCLILVPTVEEFRYIKEALSTSKFKNYVDTKVVVTGIGKVNSANIAALELTNPYDLVVCSGYCGSSDYSIGQLVNPRIAFDPRLYELSGLAISEELPYTYPLVSKDDNNSVICSTDQWVCDRVESSDATEYHCYDMETFAVAQVASELGVPVACVKVVTNDTRFSSEKTISQYKSSKEYITSFDDVFYLIAKLIKSIKKP